MAPGRVRRGDANDSSLGAAEAMPVDRNLTANTIKPVLTPIKVTAGGTPSLGSHQSHRSEASDSLSVAAEATAVGSNLTANVSGPVVAQADAIDKAIPSPRRAYSLDPDKARDYTRNKAVLSPRRSYSLDPDKARDYMKNIKQFRVLVMGRANAGKTTILQRVCSSTDHPEVFDGKGNKIDGAVVQGTLTRGYHEIERELVFQSNPGFVFHDSCGFEAGSEKQFNQVKEFVVEHAVSTSIKQRIHAIWFCIPMTDSHRTVTAAEQKFFNECDTGHVPVIVVLTKVDALNLEAIQDFEDKGLEVEGVEEKVAEREGELLEKWLAYMKDMLGKCKFPPKGYVVLKNMDEEMGDCTALIQCTANTLDEVGLQRLLISTQQSSSTLRIEFAVKVTLRDVLYFIHKEGCHVIAKELESVLLSWLQDKLWGLGGGLGLYLEGEHLAVGAIGHAFLHHYRKEFLEASKEMFEFELDSPSTILPLANDAQLSGELQSIHGVVVHAVGCLLIAEHSYFSMQHGHCGWQESVSLAVEEYEGSGVQTTISEAIEEAIQVHGDDVPGLCEAVLTIIKENRMSNKFLM